MKHSPSENSCAVKMNRLSAASCQDIVSFGNQLDLDCVFIGNIQGINEYTLFTYES